MRLDGETPGQIASWAAVGRSGQMREARMKTRMAQVAIELTLILVGLLAALAEALLVHRGDIALLIAVNSVLLPLTVVAIRQEVVRQVGEVLVDRNVLRQIPDLEWRREAEEEIEQARVRFASWAGGTRWVSERSSLNFKFNLLGRTQASVRAIHLAFDTDSLQMWDNNQRSFGRLVETYGSLPTRVLVRRILVLDAEDGSLFTMSNGVRTVVSDVVTRVCRYQMEPRSNGGLGVDLRISWVAKATSRVTDQMVVDERVACSIQSYGHGHFGDLEVVVNSAVVASRIRLFEDLWTGAVPAGMRLSLSAPQ